MRAVRGEGRNCPRLFDHWVDRASEERKLDLQSGLDKRGDIQAEFNDNSSKSSLALRFLRS